MAKLLTIKVDDIIDMKGRMSKSRQVLMDSVQKEMTAYGRLLVAAAKEEAPVKTGTLQNSIRFAVRQQGTRSMVLEVTAGNRARPPVVVKTILFGSKPHVIVPRRAKALAFSVNGRRVFAHRVKHPGTNPNNFMERALSNTERERKAMVDRIGRLTLSKILNNRS